jgi:hypothetical protein
MKHRDLTHHPDRAIVDLDSSNGPEYTPDLDHGSIFRINDFTGQDITVNTPRNLKDGWYMRFEIVTGATETITLSADYTIDAVPIPPFTNTGVLYIVEGRYNASTGKLYLREV